MFGSYAQQYITVYLNLKQIQHYNHLPPLLIVSRKVRSAILRNETLPA